LALLLTIGLVAANCSDRRKSSSTKSGGGSGTTAGGSSQTLLDTSKCPDNGTTGITGDTITFGSSYPQSGLYAPFSDVATGYKSYFKYINTEQGGVKIAGKKYKIQIKDKDDQYNAAKTISNTQSLVNDDKVFGMFAVIGTANNIGIRDFLGQQCLPDLFAGTGSPAWGNTKYPWLIGGTLPPYSDEVKAFVDYLKKHKPSAKVAVLSATDDFGKAYLETFQKLIKGTKITVVKKETYNPEDNKVDSQITSLAATNADALLAGATLLACPQALQKVKASSWNPIIYMSGTCAAKVLVGIAGPAADGLISSTNFKDPSNPKFNNDPAMKLYRAKVKKYTPNPKVDISNGIVAFGWTQGALLVEALKNAKAATRAGVMESALTLKAKGIGLLLDGLTLHSGKNDKFLGENFQVVQYVAKKGYFNDIDKPVNYDGTTDSFTPTAVVNG
jgi:branched-chain amino acid transport system substrate-binding protein